MKFDPLQEWLNTRDLGFLYQKCIDSGIKSLAAFKNIPFDKFIGMGLSTSQLAFFISELMKIEKNFPPNCMNRRLLIRNLAKNQSFDVGWRGKAMRNTIVEGNEIIFTSDEGYFNSNIEEIFIGFQEGSYWLFNSVVHPTTKISRRLQNEEEYALSPEDMVSIGDLTFVVNRFAFGQAEDKGTRAKMEDKVLIKQNMNVSYLVDSSLYAVLDG